MGALFYAFCVDFWFNLGILLVLIELCRFYIHLFERHYRVNKKYIKRLTPYIEQLGTILENTEKAV